MVIVLGGINIVIIALFVLHLFWHRRKKSDAITLGEVV